MPAIDARNWASGRFAEPGADRRAPHVDRRTVAPVKLINRREQPAPPETTAESHVAELTAMIAAGERARLGDVLVAENLITPEQLAAALNLQRSSGRQLGAILVEQGVLDPRVLTQALATQLGLPTIDLRRERPTDEALELVDEHDRPRVPHHADAGDRRRARRRHRRRQRPRGARGARSACPSTRSTSTSRRRTTCRSSINTHYRVLSSVDDDVQQIWADGVTRRRSEEIVVTGGDAPIIQLVNKIVTQALRDRASDIHVEPTEGRIRIRYRVDGALREVLSLPAIAGPELVSRIKIMAEMDIVERRRPQDGQFQMTVDGVGLDVRVATGADDLGRDGRAATARQEPLDEAAVRAGHARRDRTSGSCRSCTSRTA